MTQQDPEFVAVPTGQQLDADPAPGGDNDALTESTSAEGVVFIDDDAHDLDDYRDPDGPVWDGVSG